MEFLRKMGEALNSMDYKKPKILIVDDEPQNLFILEKVLGSFADVIKASNGQEAIDKFKEHRPDMVLSDVMMPVKNGYEVCSFIKNDNLYRNIPVVLITGLEGIEDKVKGIAAGADDFFNKPFNKQILMARIKNLLRMKHLNDMLKTEEDVILAFAVAIEARDPYTEGHIRRVSQLTMHIGKIIGIKGDEIECMRKGAILHDVGKLAIPDSLLKKPGPLSHEEMEKMRVHPIIGESICKPLRAHKIIMDMIRHHHEKINGTGYPDKLQGDEISEYVKVLCIVDVYDSLTTNRPYRRALTNEEAFRILIEEKDMGWWDNTIVNLLIEVISKSEHDSFQLVNES